MMVIKEMIKLPSLSLSLIHIQMCIRDSLRRGWAFGNQFLTYIWEGDSPSLWEDMGAFNKNAPVSKAFGFTFDTSKVQTEYAAVTNVVNEYRAALEFGLLDNQDEALEEYNARLMEAGLDKIIAEKQRQLDEWAQNQQ